MDRPAPVLASDPTRQCCRTVLQWCAWLVPVLLYLGLVVPIGYWQRDEVNPDGIIYVRKAQFLLAGHFWDSVSGYWSPATSWCIALLLKIRPHANPLYVMHVVQEFWGVLWVLACSGMLAVVLPRRPIWRILGGVAIAFAGVRLAVAWMAPDLLLGTMMMTYLALIAREDSDRRWPVTFLAGLCMGLGYLTKSYALPFFALHFPFTLAYRWWTRDRGLPWTVKIRPLLIGVVAFLIPALPWIATVSHKYGKFTISMVYQHNHLNVAPDSYLSKSPDFTVVPPDPYLCIWEGLDPGPRKDWSATSSGRFLRYQVGVAFEHVGLIIKQVWMFDAGVTLLAIVAIFLPWRRWIGAARFSPMPLWIVLTCVIYSVGFLVVAFETRYVIPIYLPLGVALSLRVLEEIGGWERVAGGIPWLRPAAGPAIACAFVVMTGLETVPMFFEQPTRPIFEKVAKELKERGLVRRFSSSNNNSGANVSYFLNQKIVLIPHAADDRGILFKELNATQTDEVLVWHDSRAEDPGSKMAKMEVLLRKNPQWKRATVIKIDSVRTVHVYVRKTALPAMNAS